jgi:pimeloyl-ACP methyl ester carboxylesterase
MARSHPAALGGVDQWVMIRGESVANAPLILLHGGPGGARRGSSPTSTRRWSRASPPCTGISAAPASRLTRHRSIVDDVEQFISDLDELVDAVCKRLGKKRVAIFGHSWGSALGVLYAARLPEKVAAYVGSGQIGDWAAADSASYEFALAEAQRRGNRRR